MNKKSITMMYQFQCPDTKKMWIFNPKNEEEAINAKKLWPQYEEGRILQDYHPDVCADKYNGDFLGSKAEFLPKKNKGRRLIDPEKSLV